jgi:hypothetical protein
MRVLHTPLKRYGASERARSSVLCTRYLGVIRIPNHGHQERLP